MLNRFHTFISDTYILRYEIPESFFDEHILTYLANKVSEQMSDYNKEIKRDSTAIAFGKDVNYHRFRKYFYENFKLRPAMAELRRIRNKYDFKFGKKKTKKLIDIEQIKENVKCEDLLGKPERSDGKRLWYKLRNERTASCCVYTETNSFYDFGSGEGGSIIDLYMKLNSCDVKEAISELTRI